MYDAVKKSVSSNNKILCLQSIRREEFSGKSGFSCKWIQRRAQAALGVGVQTTDDSLEQRGNSVSRREEISTEFHWCRNPTGWPGAGLAELEQTSQRLGRHYLETFYDNY